MFFVNMTSRRGLSCSDDEIHALLDIVGKILPIGQEEWKTAETQHDLDWAQTGRCFQSLRKKFDSFADARMPTGDAHCPPHVVEAKRILEEIEKAAEIEIHEAEFEEPAEAIEGDTVSAPTTSTEDPAGTVTPASTATLANNDHSAGTPANNGSAVPVPLGTLPGGAQASSSTASSTVPAVSNAAARSSRLQRVSAARSRRGVASADDMSIQDFSSSPCFNGKKTGRRGWNAKRSVRRKDKKKEKKEMLKNACSATCSWEFFLKERMETPQRTVKFDSGSNNHH